MDFKRRTLMQIAEMICGKGYLGHRLPKGFRAYRSRRCRKASLSAAPGHGIRVDCYAGYKGEEAPRRLIFDDRAIEVVEVIDRWPASDYRYFKLRGADGATYIIQRDVAGGRWELVMFEACAPNR